MQLSLSTAALAAAVTAALVLGATGPTIALAAPRSTAEGLLVFAVEQAGQNTTYASVDGSMTPFGAEHHDDLADALLWATELDLSAFDTDGRIKTKGFNSCLGVQPATPVRPARAVSRGCDPQDPDQVWRIVSGSGDRLRNEGTGLWVQSVLPTAGWTLTDTLADAPYRVLTDYLDGRPVVTPVVTADYDHATDSFALQVRNGPAGAAVGVFGRDDRWEPLGATGDDGSYTGPLPRDFSDAESVDVQVGRTARQTVTLRVGAIDKPRFGKDPDGTIVFYGEGGPAWQVHVGTGPLASDVVATGTSTDAGFIRIPLPDARPGDTLVVYQGISGVRTSVTVSVPAAALDAVDQPATTLDRTRSTPVPIGVRAAQDLTRITSTITMTAPAGTAFTPGTTTIDGERKPVGGAWGGVDSRFRITDVDVSADGRTLTASYDRTLADRLSTGDELRWWPSLDVVDASRAPASV